MGIFRISTGDDARSRLEEQTLESHPSLKSSLPASGVFFREFAAGTFLDWHPAPRRQVVVILSGQLEHELGNGQVRRFGPGDARIMEDTDGGGHTTRVIGDAPVIVAVVALTSER